MKILVACKFYCTEDPYFDCLAFAIIPFAMYLHTKLFLNGNKDLKCNKICKLPVSSSCLGTFLWSILLKLYINQLMGNIIFQWFLHSVVGVLHKTIGTVV